jgi:cytochrome P450
MRHALKPLLGEGLFISDGAAWAACRRIVAPTVHVSRLPSFAPIMVEAAAERTPPGPRICAGAAFGLTQAILCLAVLAQRARLRLAPGAVVEPVCRLTLRPGDALPMLVESRVPGPSVKAEVGQHPPLVEAGEND